MIDLVGTPIRQRGCGRTKVEPNRGRTAVTICTGTVYSCSCLPDVGRALGGDRYFRSRSFCGKGLDFAPIGLPRYNGVKLIIIRSSVGKTAKVIPDSKRVLVVIDLVGAPIRQRGRGRTKVEPNRGRTAAIICTGSVYTCGCFLDVGWTIDGKINTTTYRYSAGSGITWSFVFYSCLNRCCTGPCGSNDTIPNCRNSFIRALPHNRLSGRCGCGIKRNAGSLIQSKRTTIQSNFRFHAGFFHGYTAAGRIRFPLILHLSRDLRSACLDRINLSGIRYRCHWRVRACPFHPLSCRCRGCNQFGTSPIWYRNAALVKRYSRGAARKSSKAFNLSIEFRPIDDRITLVIVGRPRPKRPPILSCAVEHARAVGVHFIWTKLGHIAFRCTEEHTALSRTVSIRCEGAAKDGAGIGDGICYTSSNDNNVARTRGFLSDFLISTTYDCTIIGSNILNCVFFRAIAQAVILGPLNMLNYLS